jgi:parvulin-like peptidyl-prolyl isomerase
MPSLAQAVAQPGLAPGIIGPILEETMGYVVADYEGTRPAPAQRMADAQIMLATGADFATEVAQYSETADAIKGGDMGWISRYILPTDLEAAIFQTPVGGTSRMIQNSNGYWIFKVLAEETRTADATQQAKMKLVTFNAWLIDLTDAANVWTDTAALTALTPASTP